MLRCPSCDKPLTRSKGLSGTFWRCAGCDGRAATVTILRRSFRRGQVNRIWRSALERSEPSSRDCPACRREMGGFDVPLNGSSVRLDACRGCQLIWFDASEPERFEPVAPEVEQTGASTELPLEARRDLAMTELKKIRQQYGVEAWAPEAPEKAWKWVAALFGLPVEYGDRGKSRWPLVTWSLGALIVVVSAMGFTRPEWIEHFGFIPAEPARLGGLTLLTSFLVHIGWLHLLGNLYFLLVFGDDVEDLLGHGRILLLIAAATVVGCVLHAAIDSRSDIPLVGASGGISGVIAFYAARLPRARIGVLIFFFYWLSMPAWAAFGFWVALQLVQFWLQVNDATHVSAAGHIGGALCGLLCAWAMRARG